MGEGEGFLGRWSRLKREAREAVPSEAAEELPPEEAVDLEALPPIESLGAESDYTAFMARGVPEDLRCAALRKAWASDPAIAGFRGFAEYDWDCNAPGYGALLPTDDIKQLLGRILRDEPEAAEPAAGGRDAEEPAEVPVAADEAEPLPEAAEGATVAAEAERRA
jgi:Protein of unknown function (DUF3306)